MTFRCKACRGTWDRDELATGRGILECPVCPSSAVGSIARLEESLQASSTVGAPFPHARLEAVLDSRPKYRRRSRAA